MNTKNTNNDLSNELGFGSFFHLVFILSITYLFHTAWGVFLENQKLEFRAFGLAIFGIFVLYSFVSLVYSLFSGEKSKGAMRRIIKKESKKLSNILNEYSSEVRTIRAHLKRLTGVMKPEGFKELAVVEDLLTSLEGRLKKVQVHSKSSDPDEVYYAYTCLLEDISSTDDTMNIISNGFSMDPIALNKLQATLDNKISRVKDLVPASRGNGAYSH